MVDEAHLCPAELFSTALQEQQKLEEEIRTNYEEPPHIMQG